MYARARIIWNRISLYNENINKFFVIIFISDILKFVKAKISDKPFGLSEDDSV